MLYFGTKTLLPLVMMFLVYSLLLAQGTTDNLQLLLYPLVTGLAACYVPNLVLRWTAARRKREIFENFPDAADLMLVCVEAGNGAGCGPGQGDDRDPHQERSPGPGASLDHLEMRAGSTREKSLRNLAARTEWTRFTPSLPC